MQASSNTWELGGWWLHCLKAEELSWMQPDRCKARLWLKTTEHQLELRGEPCAQEALQQHRLGAWRCCHPCKSTKESKLPHQEWEKGVEASHSFPSWLCCPHEAHQIWVLEAAGGRRKQTWQRQVWESLQHSLLEQEPSLQTAFNWPYSPFSMDSEGLLL